MQLQFLSLCMAVVASQTVHGGLLYDVMVCNYLMIELNGLELKLSFISAQMSVCKF